MTQSTNPLSYPQDLHDLFVYIAKQPDRYIHTIPSPEKKPLVHLRFRLYGLRRCFLLQPPSALPFPLTVNFLQSITMHISPPNHGDEPGDEMFHLRMGLTASIPTGLDLGLPPQPQPPRTRGEEPHLPPQPEPQNENEPQPNRPQPTHQPNPYLIDPQPNQPENEPPSTLDSPPTNPIL